jgi:hypothetical protein
MSAIRAGLLTFLAALHGGITVAGTPADFLPLGLTALLGAIAWRAGRGLAELVDESHESDPARLVLLAAAQVGAFTLACLACVPVATLGTSSAPFLGVGGFAVLLFGLTGVVAFVRSSPLRALVAERIPAWLGPGVRVAACGLLVYLAGGALLVAASLTVHHGAVERLAARVGPGWNGAPVLLLCLLAAPNAVIAGASYLAGPGFTVGSGTTVAVNASTHGLLPAFPVLAALPSGPSSPWMWWPVVLVPLGAGGCAGSAALREAQWSDRLRACAVGAGLAALAGVVLAWQAGGGIGDGRLRTIGASPWQFGLALGVETGVGSMLVLAGAAGWAGVRAFAATLHTAAPAERSAQRVDPDAVTERLDGLRVAIAAEGGEGAEGAEAGGDDRLAG